jgi:hypothetical protein
MSSHIQIASVLEAPFRLTLIDRMARPSPSARAQH